MSVMTTTAFNEIPIEFVEYAMAHAAQGTNIVILRATDAEGYHWIATGLDSDIAGLVAQGYEMVQAYSPGIQPLVDSNERFSHSDDRCC